MRKRSEMVISVKFEWLENGRLAEHLTFNTGQTTTTTHGGGDLEAKLAQMSERHQELGRQVELAN